MANKKVLTQNNCADAAMEQAKAIQYDFLRGKSLGSQVDRIALYGIPRGGVPAAYLIKSALSEITETPVTIEDDIRKLSEHKDKATGEVVRPYGVIVDDLIDSGKTMKSYSERVPGAVQVALFDKRDDTENYWYVFPWEERGNDSGDEGIEDNVTRILQYIGEDVDRPGIIETPARVSKALLEKCEGYRFSPKDIADTLKVFEDGAENGDGQMVVVADIPVYSMCEHHMETIFGTATIGYIPNEHEPRIVGLSKFARLVNIFARRLQVQERLTNQIADAIDKHLSPMGVGVIINARHMCMESRGVRTPGSYTVTCSLRGNFKNDPTVRAEFMAHKK